MERLWLHGRWPESHQESHPLQGIGRRSTILKKSSNNGKMWGGGDSHPLFVMSEVYNSLTMSYLFLYRRFIVLKYIEVYNYSEPQG
jgi:hypothetical protein